MKLDLHNHPLGHRYYYDNTFPATLTARDEADICALLQFGIKRGLDVIGITDHDFALPGLWAANYALQQNLPLRVIAGCECELYYNSEWIHLLALKITEPLIYTAFTTPADLARQVHHQGGIIVLAHPMNYTQAIYHSLKNIVDGIEYRNGAAERRGRQPFSPVLDADGYSGLRLYNSDYHYPDKPVQEQLQAVTELAYSEVARWFGD